MRNSKRAGTCSTLVTLIAVSSIARGDDASAFIQGVPLNGEAAAAAVPRLVDIVVDSDASDELRQLAADRLGRIGEEAVAAVPFLTQVAEEERTRWAFKALTRFGPLAASAGPVFESAVSDAELHPVALEGLARTLSVRPAGLATFQRELLSDRPEDALDSLALAGGAAVPLLPFVGRIADGGTVRQRRLSVAVFRAAGREAGMVYLAALLVDEDADVFADAAAALGDIRAVDTLSTALRVEPKAERRPVIARALATAGGDMVSWLADNDAAVRLAAATSLDTAEAYKTLLRLLDADDRSIATGAYEALGDRPRREIVRRHEATTERGGRLLDRLRNSSP